MTRMMRHLFAWYFSKEKTSDEILNEVNGMLKRRSLSARCRIGENDIRRLFSRGEQKEVPLL